MNAGVARDLRAALDVKVSGAFADTFWADIALERVPEAVKKIPEAIAAFNRRFPELLAAHQEQAARTQAEDEAAETRRQQAQALIDNALGSDS